MARQDRPTPMLPPLRLSKWIVFPDGLDAYHWRNVGCAALAVDCDAVIAFLDECWPLTVDDSDAGR
jgi:hypothetical protein